MYNEDTAWDGQIEQAKAPQSAKEENRKGGSMGDMCAVLIWTLHQNEKCQNMHFLCTRQELCTGELSGIAEKILQNFCFLGII